jgi:hypothetical protein
LPLYTVRLESQTDSQWRQFTTAAKDEKDAAKLAEAREAELVGYSLTDRRPGQQIRHRRDEGWPPRDREHGRPRRDRARRIRPARVR